MRPDKPQKQQDVSNLISDILLIISYACILSFITRSHSSFIKY